MRACEAGSVAAFWWPVHFRRLTGVPPFLCEVRRRIDARALLAFFERWAK